MPNAPDKREKSWFRGVEEKRSDEVGRGLTRGGLAVLTRACPHPLGKGPPTLRFGSTPEVIVVKVASALNLLYVADIQKSWIKHSISLL